MEVVAKDRRMQKLLEDEKQLQREFGKKIARSIRERIALLCAMDNLGQASIMPHWHFHALVGTRKGQWALKLDENNRMIIIETEHSTNPPAGTQSLNNIKSVTIYELCVDYH